MDTTTFDLDRELTTDERRPGSPTWNAIADGQRNADGLIVCPLDGFIVPRVVETWLHWDRIVPKKQGGRYTLDNVQLVCPPCNQAKKAKPQSEAIAWLSRVAGMSMPERRRLSGRERQREYRARMSPEKREEVMARNRVKMREYYWRKKRGDGDAAPLPGF